MKIKELAGALRREADHIDFLYEASKEVVTRNIRPSLSAELADMENKLHYLAHVITATDEELDANIK